MTTVLNESTARAATSPSHRLRRTMAVLLDLPLTAAAQNVVPVAVTAAESVERLRQWASGRCLNAKAGGIYRINGTGTRAKPGRKVRCDPFNN